MWILFGLLAIPAVIYCVLHWIAVLVWGGRCPGCDHDSRIPVCIKHRAVVPPHLQCCKCGQMKPSFGFIMMPVPIFDTETNEVVKVMQRSSSCGDCNKAVKKGVVHEKA